MSDNTKYSYRFLRNPVSSETEIVQQRQLLRRDAAATYAKMSYSTKATELLRQSMVYFTRMEDFVGREITRRLEDIKQEKAKNKKNKKKLAALDDQAKEIQDQLKIEQNEYLDTLQALHTAAAKLDTLRNRSVKMGRAMEEEMTQTFNQQRRIRVAADEAKKKVKTSPVTTKTSAELIAEAEKEIKTSELIKNQDKKKTKEQFASMVVRKDQLDIPSGFKPIK